MNKLNINLGSGPDGVEGWINYDWGILAVLSKLGGLSRQVLKLSPKGKGYVRHWPRVVLHDLRRNIPLPNGSVKWVYSSNFIEHLEKEEARQLLRECRRVLATDGRIRLVVPDLKKVAKKYFEGGGADEFNREFFGFDKDRTSWPTRLFIRGHQWMYDEKTLRKLLEEAGFRKIETSSCRQSLMPDVDRLDLEVHQELGLYMEASR